MCTAARLALPRRKMRCGTPERLRTTATLAKTSLAVGMLAARQASCQAGVRRLRAGRGLHCTRACSSGCGAGRLLCMQSRGTQHAQAARHPRRRQAALSSQTSYLAHSTGSAQRLAGWPFRGAGAAHMQTQCQPQVHSQAGRRSPRSLSSGSLQARAAGRRTPADDDAQQECAEHDASALLDRADQVGRTRARDQVAIAWPPGQLSPCPGSCRAAAACSAKPAAGLLPASLCALAAARAHVLPSWHAIPVHAPSALQKLMSWGLGCSSQGAARRQGAAWASSCRWP